jgi:hypothetical protein
MWLEKLPKRSSYENSYVKTLMKLTLERDAKPDCNNESEHGDVLSRVGLRRLHHGLLRDESGDHFTHTNYQQLF